VQIKIIEETRSDELESAINDFLRKNVLKEDFMDVKIMPIPGQIKISYTAMVVFTKAPGNT